MAVQPIARTADQLHRELASATIAFHEVLARRLGMGAAERKVFEALAELSVATPGQLARASGFTSGAITGIVDRLEKSGFARREDNPADRRSVLVRPLQVDRVRRLQEPLFQSLTHSMAEMRQHFSKQELSRILKYLAETIDVLRAESEKMESTGSADHASCPKGWRQGCLQ